jgi:hypothetical protein
MKLAGVKSGAEPGRTIKAAMPAVNARVPSALKVC